MARKFSGNTVKVQLKITGIVQGVGFRYFARATSDELGIELLQAENMPDGSLILEIEGKRNAVEKFIDWARNGPERARVSFVEIFKADEN
jgi:acylphosphatase